MTCPIYVAKTASLESQNRNASDIVIGGIACIEDQAMHNS